MEDLPTIVGHSERRAYHAESDELVAQKAHRLGQRIHLRQEVVNGGAQQHGAQQRAQKGLPGQAHGGGEPAFAFHPGGHAHGGHGKGQLHCHGQQHVPAEEQHGQRARTGQNGRADQEDGHHRNDHHGAVVGTTQTIQRAAGQVAQAFAGFRAVGHIAHAGHLGRARAATAGHGAGQVGRVHRHIQGIACIGAAVLLLVKQARCPPAQHQQINAIAHSQRDGVAHRQQVHARLLLQPGGQQHAQQREGANAQAMPAQAVALLKVVGHVARGQAHRDPAAARGAAGGHGAAL